FFLPWYGAHRDLHSFPTRRSSDLAEGFKAGSGENAAFSTTIVDPETMSNHEVGVKTSLFRRRLTANLAAYSYDLHGAQLNKTIRSEEHTSELQSRENLVCRLLLEK